MRSSIGKAVASNRGDSETWWPVYSGVFDYGGFMATFETGLDRVGRFDAHIEVFTGTERVRIDYDTLHPPTAHASVDPRDGRRSGFPIAKCARPSAMHIPRQWEAVLRLYCTWHPGTYVS